MHPEDIDAQSAAAETATATTDDSFTIYVKHAHMSAFLC